MFNFENYSNLVTNMPLDDLLERVWVDAQDELRASGELYDHFENGFICFSNMLKEYLNELHLEIPEHLEEILRLPCPTAFEEKLHDLKLCVGDEVEFDKGERVGIVVGFLETTIDSTSGSASILFNSCGHIKTCHRLITSVKKTGRHFEQFAQMFDK